jgi:hypothetical protein
VHRLICAGETFGALVALLFAQQAVEGAAREFRRPAGGAAGGAAWRLVNGVWGLFLASGLLLSALAVRRARRWRFLRAPLRGFLADYGVPLLLAAWAGLSYAVAGPPGVPSRVGTPDTWRVRGSWTVAKVRVVCAGAAGLGEQALFRRRFSAGAFRGAGGCGAALGSRERAPRAQPGARKPSPPLKISSSSSPSPSSSP